jgi:macrolide transport system ATP-binding/permease protein
VLIQDVRYAWRQLLKTPGFTITAVITLALGLGANAAIFTLLNAVLLKNLPVADPRALVRLGDAPQCCVNQGARDDGNYSLFSTDTYEQLKKNNPEFEELAAMQAGFTFRPMIARRDGASAAAKSIMGEFVSGNYFSMFGLRPAIGRLLTVADDAQGAPMVAVLSYDTWKNEYGRDPSVIGSTLWINTKAVTMVGVGPEGFYGDRLVSTPPQYYLVIPSLPQLQDAGYVNEPAANWLYMIGRLKPGVPWVPLQERLSVQLKQVFATSGSFASAHDRPLLDKVHVVLTPGGSGIQSLQQQYASHLELLMWVSALVLLIACANIANLLLVRGMSRQAEMAVRAALGAGRGRLVRELLTESLLLALIGGVAALLVSSGGSKLVLTLAFPGQQRVPIGAAPSAEVLLFAASLSMLTGVLFGTAPALISSRATPADLLRGNSRSTTGGTSLLQRALVVAQAGLSLVLLVAAGLFAQNLSKLEHMDMKLDPTNRYIVHFSMQAAGYATTDLEALYHRIEERFHAVPSMMKVGLASYTPMEDNNNGWGVQIQGRPYTNQGASFIKANAEYFDSVGTLVVMGRGITSQDTPAAPSVAIVNRSFVKKFFAADENPIGHRFGSPGSISPGDYVIAGVVEDTAYQSVKWKDHAMFFVPLMQRPASTKVPIEKDGMLYVNGLVLETARPTADMQSIAERTLASINPNISVVTFQTFQAQIDDRFSEERLLSRLVTLFGVLALLLATVGLHGVTAYGVARRTREIGIRMALGAPRAGVVAAVVRGALVQTAIGLAIGIPVAVSCVQFIKSQLYETDRVSPAALAIATVALLGAAFVAGFIPGRRAASIDPARALRSE